MKFIVMSPSILLFVLSTSFSAQATEVKEQPVEIQKLERVVIQGHRSSNVGAASKSRGSYQKNHVQRIKNSKKITTSQRTKAKKKVEALIPTYRALSFLVNNAEVIGMLEPAAEGRLSYSKNSFQSFLNEHRNRSVQQKSNSDVVRFDRFSCNAAADDAKITECSLYVTEDQQKGGDIDVTQYYFRLALQNGTVQLALPVQARYLSENIDDQDKIGMGRVRYINDDDERKLILTMLGE